MDSSRNFHPPQTLQGSTFASGSAQQQRQPKESASSDLSSESSSDSSRKQMPPTSAFQRKDPLKPPVEGRRTNRIHSLRGPLVKREFVREILSQREYTHDPAESRNFERNRESLPVYPRVYQRVESQRLPECTPRRGHAQESSSSRGRPPNLPQLPQQAQSTRGYIPEPSWGCYRESAGSSGYMSCAQDSLSARGYIAQEHVARDFNPPYNLAPQSAVDYSSSRILQPEIVGEAGATMPDYNGQPNQTDNKEILQLTKETQTDMDFKFMIDMWDSLVGFYDYEEKFKWFIALLVVMLSFLIIMKLIFSFLSLMLSAPGWQGFF